ncbi:hypothetical protein AMJ83_06935 [candidate division WOR_3 bacterium SM23_42]|uniref:DUF58 domain-containing protein n=1 Tax=candidate division WOR_3 bacterium SM23_42 TaxID=1703779 RepID=A0A0S8FRM2_UNCW3|nr:MAG: hypothetical protein AMJ83_06935 [candidate division WOR_3 bacterium SM23_42]
MLSTEFLQKIRRIEIRTKKLVNTMFAGEYKSTFKGTGVEFLDVREYLPGDDVRTIDWKVTARMGRPYVKKFAEDRELTVILCVDASGSGHFSTRKQFKLEQAAEIAATLAFSAVRNNDKVGLLFFTDRVEKYVPPKKGRFHVLRLIRDILYFKPQSKGTDPTMALEFLMHILKHRAIIFFLSDFLGEGFEPETLRIPIGVVARRHDFVVITITDPAENVLPRIGLLELEDAETGEIVAIDTYDKRLLDDYRAHRLQDIDNQRRLLKSLGIDSIDLLTSDDFTPKLHKFFQERARRYR